MCVGVSPVTVSLGLGDEPTDAALEYRPAAPTSYMTCIAAAYWTPAKAVRVCESDPLLYVATSLNFWFGVALQRM